MYHSSKTYLKHLLKNTHLQTCSPSFYLGRLPCNLSLCYRIWFSATFWQTLCCTHTHQGWPVGRYESWGFSGNWRPLTIAHEPVDQSGRQLLIWQSTPLNICQRIRLSLLLIKSLRWPKCSRAWSRVMSCMVPFWIGLLMPCNKNFGPFDFVHPIKNEEGKKNANFRGFRARFPIL